jgi:hypothetical protein
MIQKFFKGLIAKQIIFARKTNFYFFAANNQKTHFELID